MNLYIHSEALEENPYPAASPFVTQRARKTLDTIRSMGLMDGSDRAVLPPVPVTREEMQRFHSPDYLDALVGAEEGRIDDEILSFGLGSPDCPIFKGMNAYARHAAGGTVTGARAILDGEATAVFNPSGGYHHAHARSAAGFCYINDIVLGAMTLADAGKRVFFLDVDVHHCDGVQEAFESRKDVMTLSFHESGKTLFPGTGFESEIGHGDGEGYTVNVPLPVGTYDAAYLHAFREVADPLMRAYAPDVVILEMGMDTLAGDPLAHLNLTNNVHIEVLESVLKLGVPVLMTGGGGYHVEHTVRGWALVWSVLCGDHREQETMALGGVMMGNTDWLGGLKDRPLLTDAGRRGEVDDEINRVVGEIRKHVFPIHSL